MASAFRDNVILLVMFVFAVKVGNFLPVRFFWEISDALVPAENIYEIVEATKRRDVGTEFVKSGRPSALLEVSFLHQRVKIKEFFLVLEGHWIIRLNQH